MFTFLPSAKVALLSAAGIVGFCAAGVLSPSYAQDAEGSFCSQLLTAHPQGGAGLAGEVQVLVAASPDLASDIHGCACPAEGADASALPNAGQSQALGKGLANAIKKIKNPDLVDERSEERRVGKEC